MSAREQLISLTLYEVAAIKRAVFRERTWANRASLALAIHMKAMWQERGDYWPVWDAVEHLERDALDGGTHHIPTTKPSKPFDEPPLDRFWHQHVTAPHHLLRNLAIRVAVRHGGNTALDVMINDVARKHGQAEEVWPRRLAHGLTTEAYEQRSADRRMTGDWLIFAKYQGMNYYLLYVPHPPDKSRDAEIYRRLERSCKAEFPLPFV